MIFRRLEAEERDYIREMKEARDPHRGESGVYDTEGEMQTLAESRTTSIVREQNTPRRSYARWPDGNPIDSPNFSSLHPRNAEIDEASSAAELRPPESSASDRQSGSLAQTGEDVPLRLEDTKWSKRIKLLWRVKHMRR
jgi:hypothetical protein